MEHYNNPFQNSAELLMLFQASKIIIILVYAASLK